MHSLKIGDMVQNKTNPLQFGLITGEMYDETIARFHNSLGEPYESKPVFLVHWFSGEESIYPPRLLTKVEDGTR